MLFGLVTLISLSGALAHSWMSCPPSFNTMPVRGGFTSGSCEPWLKGGETKVNAGDRLKVGWTSNNHAGGYVRLALVPEGQRANFKQNVMKVACYGSDQRPGKTKYGDCVHPCNTRPGCQYQSDPNDVERYDTTITIPTNLKDGTYILQYAALVGNGGAPYFSCAKLIITGGDPTMNCKSSKEPVKYKCHRSAGPPMQAITAGTKRGEFCYHKNKMGDVDDRIREVPINVDCDPRITCDNSVSYKKCSAAEGMKNIKNAWDPKQPNCGNVKPPPPPTCNDKKQNQGEKDIDCGGPCKPCPTAPPNTGRYHSNIDHTISRWGSGSITVHINKNVPKDWVLTIQYNVPIKIYSAWGGGYKAGENKGGNIITFKPNAWNPLPRKGSTIEISFTSTVPSGQEVQPLTMTFELDEDSNPVKRSIRQQIHVPGCESMKCEVGFECVAETISPCRQYPCHKSFCKKIM